MNEIDNTITFGPAEGAEPTPITQLEPGDAQWKVERDLGNATARVKVLHDRGTFRFDDWNWNVSHRVEESYELENDQWDTVKGAVLTTLGLSRGNFRIRTTTYTELTSDRDHFRIEAELKAYEGDAEVFSKTWDEKVERDLL